MYYYLWKSGGEGHGENPISFGEFDSPESAESYLIGTGWTSLDEHKERYGFFKPGRASIFVRVIGSVEKHEQVHALEGLEQRIADM